MAQTFHFLKIHDALYEAIPADIEAQLLLKFNDANARETLKEEKGGETVIIMVAMLVVCLSFVSIFTVPARLENELGLSQATEAMESVEFKIFVVMNALSFFPSMGVVLMVLQFMAMEKTSHSHVKKVAMSLCNRVAYMAAGSAVIAFVFAAITFTRRL